MDHDDDGETSYNTFVDDVAFEPTYSQALLTAAGRNVATLSIIDIDKKELCYFDVRNEIDNKAGRIFLALHSLDKPLQHGADGGIHQVGGLHLVHARLTQLFFEHLADGDAVKTVHIGQTVDILALLRTGSAEYKHDRRR